MGQYPRGQCRATNIATLNRKWRPLPPAQLDEARGGHYNCPFPVDLVVDLPLDHQDLFERFAMANDTPAIVAFPIPKGWITSGDFASAVGILSGMMNNAQSAKLYAGKVLLSFDGWDSDPRPLCEIPEVCSWFRNLDRSFPYWFVFANRTTDTIPSSTTSFSPPVRGCLTVWAGLALTIRGHRSTR
ncbi:hypothetical protein [Duganella vulcania]|uniref:Uncharacterized protein n=1 Tax=Duganella vulcania TaxID=2692166 RepID=A0A845GI41_9BURK|nr:hypothetical protein [Duganella vulcania]MYM92339.1 hypothetical protein [Duganella vulcania]